MDIPASVDTSVMVIDDDLFMLKVAKRMLGKLGFENVTTIDNGASALQDIDIASAKPDLILLDLNMPQMDGIEFIRKLVGRNSASALILFSGEDERIIQSAEKLARVHGIRVLGHLQKPIKAQMLRAILASYKSKLRTRKIASKTKIYGADELQAAIAGGQLVNYYQPKVVVATREVVGVEALVRWRHPTDGLVYPSQFIDTAETSGLMDELTRAVLGEALTDVKIWREAGISIEVAVNVSMKNLVSLDFPDVVASIAAKAGVTTKSLTLEVTESCLMEDVRSTLDILARLRLKGVGLSIDDFGTGYSSLTQLRDLPFNQLKIDRSFVQGAHSNDSSKAIYLASLAMARQLNMDVVAEGVEDYQDWGLLCETECDIAQGYFICWPMPANKLSDWIASWKQRGRIDSFISN